MTFKKWIEINHNDMLELTRTITKTHDEAVDLYACVVEQLLNKSNKIDETPDNQKKYYFIRVLKNNYNSKTSPYHYQYRKPRQHLLPIIEGLTEDFVEEEYEETIPTMEWVEKTLNEEFGWYERDLFFLWVEMGTLTKLSYKTQIPLNSVGRQIKTIKLKLKELWDKVEHGN